MKKVLGLDLGTTSIGWALVNQAENDSEQSSIIQAGSRVNPLSTEEEGNFPAGKDITTNSERRIKRGMRRNLQRYKLRRDSLLSLMKNLQWIDDTTILSEDGKNSTFKTYRLRAKAVTEQISREELAKVFLMINKKRGYRSSRKTDNSGQEEGALIDGMEVAKFLYDNNLTPAQHSLELLNRGIKKLPDYYRSDLTSELERIWNKQASFRPEILTPELYDRIKDSSSRGIAKIFFDTFGVYSADNKGKERREQALKWRAQALEEELTPEVLAYVIDDVIKKINGSSGYLGEISDRSKMLYFTRQTVGQYLMSELEKNPQFRVKNKVFYRQDYLDEFERIWETQAPYYPEMTPDLKHEFRDIIIFYQRRLKSQKGLISLCEFESKKIKRVIDGQEKEITVGCKVAPRSSLLFQEFKILSILNNLRIMLPTGEALSLNDFQRQNLLEELEIKEKLYESDILRILNLSPKLGFTLNYKEIEGNRTLSALYAKFLDIVAACGDGEYKLAATPACNVKAIVRDTFVKHGFNTALLEYDSSLDKEAYEQQPLFKLWHLMYSYEGDSSRTGNESLIAHICSLSNMPREEASIIAGTTFLTDYASLSHKAMRKILPYLKEGHKYSDACQMAGYRHSAESLTKEEIDKKELVDHIPNLPKNSLRNPVVEKILNQMINVVNALDAEYGRPDEIHVEMARELKQSKQEREKATEAINKNTKENKEIEKKLKEAFGLTHVSRNDIIRYKLYEELKENGYKTLYSNQYIPKELLFTPNIDIEHIVPQASLFDDSYANKTLEFRDVNLKKGNTTAADFVLQEYGEAGWNDYKQRVEDLYKRHVIGKRKRNRLLTKFEEIPVDFVNRDLVDTQYIAKKAKEILSSYVRVVMPTNGSITAKLREDWRLVNVVQELNMEKYDIAGMTYYEEDRYGRPIKKIQDWSKRNDHRHHAMDAITIAFTRPIHIQLLNNMSARSRKEDSFYGAWHKEARNTDSGWVFNPPMPYDELRSAVKSSLESVLVSHKAKNKVVTKNINRIKSRNSGAKPQLSLTPRGSIHEESVHGPLNTYAVSYLSIGSRMTRDVINTVARKVEREALLRRLEENGGDPKKAFTGSNSPSKKPIYIDNLHSKALPNKVKCVTFARSYKIRKPIDSSLTLSKVVDAKVRRLLEARVESYGGDIKAAFSNLDENPIWFNEEKRIPLKTVTISENFDPYAIHSKKDKEGKPVLDSTGNEQAADYVKLKNNHHAAVYIDAKGKFQENIVSFAEAVERARNGMPIVDKTYKNSEGWKFVFSLKINEMFVFPDSESGFFPEEMDLTDTKNYALISPHLFRVKNLSSKDYCFRHHLEATSDDTKELKDKTWKRITSLDNLKGVVKVRINHIGRIVAVGEE